MWLYLAVPVAGLGYYLYKHYKQTHPPLLHKIGERTMWTESYSGKPRVTKHGKIVATQLSEGGTYGKQYFWQHTIAVDQVDGEGGYIGNHGETATLLDTMIKPDNRS